MRYGPKWHSPTVLLGALRAVDVLLIGLIGVIAYYVRHGPVDLPVAVLFALVTAMLLAANVFHVAGVYSLNHLSNLFYQTTRLLLGWSGVVALLLVIGFFTKSLADMSRLWVVYWVVGGFVAMFALRIIAIQVLHRLRQAGKLARDVVVVGAGEHGQRLIDHLRRHEHNVRIVGVFDDRAERAPAFVGGYPVLGTIDDLLTFARTVHIDQVIVALPWDAEKRLLEWMKRLRSLPVDVRLCPDLIGFHLPYRGVTHLAGVPLLNVFVKPLSGWDWVLKTLEDRILATLILIGISPLMIGIAIAVKLSSPGPVFFRQQRYGYNNEVIEVLKFRSMYHEDSEFGDGEVQQATKGDKRITPIGGVLRKTSLDELPQFINVLMGDMSIVGPRPHAVSHNEQYARVIGEYLARHRVKPGITGWAQVNGLRGETDTLEKMEQRVQYDLYYIENWSLSFDLRIILLTALVGFTDPAAY